MVKEKLGTEELGNIFEKTDKKEERENNFFKWVIRKWHFWLLSVGWGTWSAYEDIVFGYSISAITTIIGWTLIIGLIYLIIFYIMKGINRFISKRVEEEVKSKLKK